jgi:hypothetical protein
MTSSRRLGPLGPAKPGTAQLCMLTIEERERIAQHAEREVADRVFRELRDRATLAQAEYRFMDLMDRYIVALVGSTVLALLICLGLATAALRWMDHFHGTFAGCNAHCASWIVIAMVLSLYLSGLVLFLRRKVMGRQWLRTEMRLPWTTPGWRTRSRKTLIIATCAALAAGLLAWIFDQKYLLYVAFAFAAVLIFVVYSKLALRR